MRSFGEGVDLPLPSWAKLLNDKIQQKVQARAQNSLAEALGEYRDRKGKGRSEINSGWRCGVDQCPTSLETYTPEAFLDHLRDLHNYPEDDLAKIKQCLDEEENMGREDKGGREPNDIERDGPPNKKRGFVEEEYLDDSSSNSSSGCIPGPSKRVRAA